MPVQPEGNGTHVRAPQSAAFIAVMYLACKSQSVRSNHSVVLSKVTPAARMYLSVVPPVEASN